MSPLTTLFLALRLQTPKNSSQNRPHPLQKTKRTRVLFDFLPLLLVLCFLPHFEQGLCSTTAADPVIWNLEKTSIKMTGVPMMTEIITVNGHQEVVTFSWKEGLIRFYPLSDDGSIDQSSQAFVNVKTLQYDWIQSIGVNADGTRVAVHDGLRVYLYSRSDGSLVYTFMYYAVTYWNPYFKFYMGSTHGNNYFTISSYYGAYFSALIINPSYISYAWKSQADWSIGNYQTRLTAKISSEKFATSAYGYWIIYIFSYASGGWNYFYTNSVAALHKGYYIQKNSYNSVYTVDFGSKSTAYYKDVTTNQFHMRHLVEMENGMKLSTFFHPWNSDDSGRFVFDFYDGYMYSDSNVHSHMNYMALPWYISPNPNHINSDYKGVFTLNTKNNLIVAGAEVYMGFGGIRTWDQRDFDIDKPEKSSVTAFMWMTRDDETGRFVFTRQDEVFYVEADLTTVIEQTRVHIYVFRVWFGEDSSTVYFYTTPNCMASNDGTYRFQKLWKWNLGTGTRPQRVLRLPGWQFGLEGKFDRASNKNIIQLQWSSWTVENGVLADSIGWFYPNPDSLYNLWNTQSLFEAEGARDSVYIFAGNGDTFIVDVDSVSIIKSASGADWVKCTVHFAAIEKMFMTRSDMSMYYAEIPMIDDSSTSFSEEEYSEFKGKCNRLLKTQRGLQAICFHFMLTYINAIDFTSGFPDVLASTMEFMKQAEGVSDYRDHIPIPLFGEFIQFPWTNTIVMTVNLGTFLWDITRFFKFEINISACDEGCEECLPGEPSVCSTCVGSRYILQNDEITCSDGCPTGYFTKLYDGLHANCVKCAAPCFDCMGSENACTSCILSDEMNILQYDVSDCSSTCPEGYVQVFDESGFRMKCDKCESPCFTCEGSVTQCTSCLNFVSNYLLQYDSMTCSDGCPPTRGRIMDDDGIHWKCVPCEPPCKTCSEPTVCQSILSESDFLEESSSSSSSSEEVYEIYSMTGECSDGRYAVKDEVSQGVNCFKCQKSCGTCSGSDSCLTCKDESWSILSDGLCGEECSSGWLADDSNVCQKCHSTCKTCFSFEENGCRTCEKPLAFDSQTSTCIEECKFGYFETEADLDGSGKMSKVCSPCNYPCETCVKSETTCKSCFEGYSYEITTGSCEAVDVECPPNCSFCNSLTSCSICDSGFYLNSQSLLCEEVSDDCASDCEICSAPERCLKCSVGYLLNQTCVDECPEDMFQSPDMECKECLVPNCQKCVGNSQSFCEQCKEDYFLVGSFCSATCLEGYILKRDSQECIHPEDCEGDGFYFDTTNSECLSCPKGCDQCKSTECFVCSNGFTKTSLGCQIDSLTNFGKNSVLSDQATGEYWAPNQEDIQDVNPVLTHSYSPNELKVIMVLKNKILDFGSEELKLQKKFSGILIGKSSGKETQIEPKSMEANYIQGSSEYVEVKFKFSTNETLETSKFKVWIDSELKWEPDLEANLYTKTIGRLEFLSSSQKAVASTTGAVSGATVSSIAVLSPLFGTFNPACASFLTENILFSTIQIDQPQALQKTTSNLASGYLGAFLPSPLLKMDDKVYTKVLENDSEESSTTSETEDASNVAEEETTSEDTEETFNEDDFSDSQSRRALQGISEDPMSSTLSQDEETSAVSELMEISPGISNIGIRPIMITSIFWPFIIQILLFIPLLILCCLRKKKESKLYQLLHGIRWKLPISFLFLQCQTFTTAVFMPLQMSSSIFWFNAVNGIVAVYCAVTLFAFVFGMFFYTKSAVHLDSKPLQDHVKIPAEDADEEKMTKSNCQEPQTAPITGDFDFIFNDFNKGDFWSRLTPLVVLVLNIINTSIAILFETQPGLVLSTIIVSSGYLIIYTVRFKSFEDKDMLFVFVMNKLVTIFIGFCLFFYGFVLDRSHEPQREKLSSVMQTVLFLQMIGNFTYFCVIRTIMFIYRYLRNKRVVQTSLKPSSSSPRNNPNPDQSTDQLQELEESQGDHDYSQGYANEATPDEEGPENVEEENPSPGGLNSEKNRGNQVHETQESHKRTIEEAEKELLPGLVPNHDEMDIRSISANPGSDRNHESND